MTTVDARARSTPQQVTDWFTIFDYTCAVRTTSVTARTFLHRLYAPNAVRLPAGSPDADIFALDPPAPGDRRWRVRLGEDLLHLQRSLGCALQQLEFEICRRVLAHRADLLAVHGATIFAAAGTAAAIITGPSGAGKSLLTLALAARGYRVGGDDIALFDPRSGVLWPFPRCFHLDAHAWRLARETGLKLPVAALRHRFLTPADVSVARPQPAPLRHVFLAGRGTQSSPHLTELTQAEVAVGLLPQLSWSTHARTAAISALLSLTVESSGYRLISGDLAATASAVAGVLGPP